MTDTVFAMLQDEGWDEIAEAAINDWCAKHWSSSVPADVAGEVVAGALLTDPEFLSDLSARSINPDSIDWVRLADNVLDVMTDRRLR